MAIARHFICISKTERADEYIAHLKNDTFKKLETINGFMKASILKRNVENGIEFLIITEWENIEAIKKFAGDDYEIAVVPQIVKDIMIYYDERVRHYDRII